MQASCFVFVRSINECCTLKCECKDEPQGNRASQTGHHQVDIYLYTDHTYTYYPEGVVIRLARRLT